METGEREKSFQLQHYKDRQAVCGKYGQAGPGETYRATHTVYMRYMP